MASNAAPILLVERQGPIVKLTLNRPERRNALSRALVAQMNSALGELAHDEDARLVVLAANGEMFCSGHDLGEMVGRSREEYQSLFASCATMMQRLRRLPQPVVARVQGLATAAGCQLVASCDLAVAAESAAFATPGIKIGLFCTTPMVPLVRAVPPKVAMEMLLTGRPISAREALAAGLINRVAPDDQLDQVLAELCGPIVASSPMTIRLGKAAFYDQLANDEPTAYAKAVPLIASNASRHDAQEGISAFLQKRTPNWKGE